MTPEKLKKPLPRLYAGAQPSRQTPFQRWRASLKELRALFDRAQYKECAALCEKLLEQRQTRPHPTHASALHFYAAMSNELIAKGQHNFAATKLPLLNSARSSYLTALSLLPAPEVVSPQFEDAEDFSDDDSASVYSVATDASAVPHTPDLDFALPVANPFSRPKSHDFQPPHHLMPLKPLPLFHVPIVHRVTFAEPEPPSPRLETRARYKERLADFRDTLDRHHSEVIALIVATMDAQAHRYSARRSMMVAEEIQREKEKVNGDLKKARLRGRIKELKERGWKRERFDPSRYEDLCERALAEL